jgi:hypothetical protein
MNGLWKSMVETDAHKNSLSVQDLAHETTNHLIALPRTVYPRMPCSEVCELWFRETARLDTDKYSGPEGTESQNKGIAERIDGWQLPRQLEFIPRNI